MEKLMTKCERVHFPLDHHDKPRVLIPSCSKCGEPGFYGYSSHSILGRRDGKFLDLEGWYLDAKTGKYLCPLCQRSA